MSEQEMPENGALNQRTNLRAAELAAHGTRRRRRFKMAVALGVIALAAVLSVGCGAEDANGAVAGEAAVELEKPVPVEVVAAAQGDIAAYVSATANLVAENDVAVLSELEGRVTSLSTDEGRTVGRGQILARLDSSDEEIALKKAQLRHANSELVYERGQDLMAKELISREENDRLTVDYQVSKQELAEAEWALAQTVIRSPFSGQVTARHIQLGQHIRPGDPLFQITDFDPLIARIYLSESDIVGLEPGTPARIQLNANPGLKLAARIRQISPVVDTATGTVKVTVEAIDPPPGVRPGSFVSIHVVRETHPDAVLVPREAILRELQSSHVFVSDANKAVKRAVTVGLEEAGQVEILSGLSLGDQVVVAGQGGLREGTLLSILGEDAPPEEALEAEAESPAEAE